MNGLLIACGLLVVLLVVCLAIETWRPLGPLVRQPRVPEGIVVSERADVMIIADEFLFSLYQDGHVEVTAPNGTKIAISAGAAMGLTWHLARQYGWIQAGGADGKGPP
jgi:hypothetical protein